MWWTLLLEVFCLLYQRRIKLVVQDDVRRRVAEAKATLAKHGDAAEGAAGKPAVTPADAPRK